MKNKHSQSGTTLVVSMIMLTVLSLLVFSAIRSSTTNLRITGNMQVQGETTAAAQQAIEQVLESDFVTAPATQSVTIDMGAAIYTADVSQPVCAGTVEIPQSELKQDDPDDFQCFGSNDPMAVTQVDTGGTERQLHEASLCNQQLWELQARVTDANSGATSNVVQGLRLRAGRTSGC